MKSTKSSATQHRPSARGVRAVPRLALLGALSLGLLAWAGPAAAEREFEDAFEAELGRIAAHHVASVGALLLYGPPPPVKVVHREVVHRHHRGCGHPKAFHRHGHHPRHDRHYRHGHRGHGPKHHAHRGRGPGKHHRHDAHPHRGRHRGEDVYRGHRRPHARRVTVIEETTVVHRAGPRHGGRRGEGRRLASRR